MKNPLKRWMAVAAATAAIFATAGLSSARADHRYDRRDRGRSRSEFSIELRYDNYDRRGYDYDRCDSRYDRYRVDYRYRDSRDYRDCDDHYYRGRGRR
jgi:hypothetical protein